MAAASRYGSSMLSRVVMASTTPRAAFTMPARALSTSSALQASKGNDAPKPHVRQNPLVGNFTPRRKPTQTSPVSPEARPRAATPPPPPPRLAESQLERESIPSDGLGSKPTTLHAYNAASEKQPLPSTDAVEGANDATEIPDFIDIASIVSTKSAAYGALNTITDPMSLPKLRTAPVLGRTIFVKNYMGGNAAPNAAMAFKLLQRTIGQERVRNKFHSQKFHERRGLKRKRLRSERWRSRFKEGFKATVERVMELKRQGW